jgi:quercetin dioxygenase-like cupin family protein
MSSAPNLPRVLLRGELSSGQVSVTEGAMPPGAKGPPLHTHEFAEAFYVLEGQLTFQVGDQLTVADAGKLA